MQDFNSIYSDYHTAFVQGHNDGAQEAKEQTQDDPIQEAKIFAKQFGAEIAIYETFIKGFNKAQNQDKEKSIKKLHSSIVEQKISELKQKINNITESFLNSDKSLLELNYSVQFLQYDRKDLKSKFQTILSILGMKDYDKRALVFIGQNPSSYSHPQAVEQDQDEALDF